MKFYQLNLTHCEVAQDLLQQSVLEQQMDVTILSEQFRDFKETLTWFSDSTGKAAIWVCGGHFIQEYPSTLNSSFTRVKFQGYKLG